MTYRIYSAHNSDKVIIRTHSEEEETLIEILADVGIISYDALDDEILDTQTYKQRTKGEYYR